MSSPGLLDGSAIVIDDLKNRSSDETTDRHLGIMAQTAGAILRVMRRRFASDALELLTVALVVDAYCNEFARVVRDWPDNGDCLAPLAFFGAAQLLQRKLAGFGWMSPPEPLPAGLLPSVLDQHPAWFVVRNRDWLFATQPALEMIGTDAASLRAEPFTEDRLVTQRCLAEFTRDMESIARGGCIVGKRYETTLAPGYDLLVAQAESAYDDDHQLIGDLFVVTTHQIGRPVPSYDPNGRSLLLSRRPELSTTGWHGLSGHAHAMVGAGLAVLGALDVLADGKLDGVLDFLPRIFG